MSELGSGGCGTVYKAWHIHLGKYVAVKESNCRAPSAALLARFHEFEALNSVKSPFLPQVYDYMAEKDLVFTVMEYIEGDSFAALLKSGRRFSPSDIVHWYSQLATALEDIHRQEVCHRDIKPANIILQPCGDVCLVDFNSAIVRGKSAHNVSRSPGYASPEQNEIFERVAVIKTRMPKSQISQLICNIDWKRSDIYSLGASMHHLLTGNRPQGRAEEVADISNSGRLSAGLARIISRSMQPEPSKRFASASDLSHALKKIHNLRS